MATNRQARKAGAEQREIGALARAVGSSGLRQFGGIVQEEFLKELQGERGAKVYREMADNDASIGAVLYAVQMLIRAAKWSFQAASETPEGEAGADFMTSVIDGMDRPFTDVITEIATMFTFGYAPMEITLKRRDGALNSEGMATSDDGMVGVADLALRQQTTLVRWEFEGDKLVGMWQQPISGPMVMIPAGKLLLFRTQAVAGNPEGRSILRSAYRSWFYKKRLEEIEGVGIERDLAGLPVAEIPLQYMTQTATPEEKAVFSSWQTMVRNVRRDAQEGLVLPSDRDASGNKLFDFKLLSSGGSRAINTTAVIDRYSRAMATAVLADFIFLGQQSVGSFALSSDKTALFATALGGFMASIAETLQRGLVARVWAINGLPPEHMPTLVAGDLEKPNLAELGQFITAMSGAGAQFFPDRQLENFVRSAAGLPPAPEEEGDMGDGSQGPGGDEETPGAGAPDGQQDVPADQEAVGGDGSDA